MEISSDSVREKGERGRDRHRGWAGGQSHTGVCAGHAKKELALPFADSHSSPTGIIGTIDFHLFLMSATDIDISSCRNTATDRRNEWKTSQMTHTNTYPKALPF